MLQMSSPSRCSRQGDCVCCSLESLGNFAAVRSPACRAAMTVRTDNISNNNARMKGQLPGALRDVNAGWHFIEREGRSRAKVVTWKGRRKRKKTVGGRRRRENKEGGGKRKEKPRGGTRGSWRRFLSKLKLLCRSPGLSRHTGRISLFVQRWS